MNWPIANFIDKVFCGDNLLVMKEMPDESIDMVITSPPYWGLRDYGFEMIFGGDKGCEHEWGPDLIQKQRGVAAGKTAQVGNQKKKIQGTHINQGNICQKCQAWNGQLGLEPTPEFYVEHLTEIFNEAKRVLKKEGTLWIVIGDTYGGSGGAGGDYNEGGLREGQPRFKQGETKLQPKCLCMIPERLAWSLIQDGWILRNKNIWYKRNAMPSSVTDRFSNRYEFVYMFSKSNKSVYWTNKKTFRLVVKQPLGIKGKEGEDWEWRKCPKCEGCGKIIEKDIECSRCKGLGKIKINFWKAHNYYFDLDAVREPTQDPMMDFKRVMFDVNGGNKKHKQGGVSSFSTKNPDIVLENLLKGKNPGDVFEINTQPFPEAHFAVFPEKLCEKPIKAGCPEEVCKKCGKARERVIEREKTPLEVFTKTTKPQDGKVSGFSDHGGWHGAGQKLQNWRNEHPNKTIGRTSCKCNAGFEGGIVLDPFAGAGTVGVVAKSLGRNFILIDVKKEYCDMCEKRLIEGIKKKKRKIK